MQQDAAQRCCHSILLSDAVMLPRGSKIKMSARIIRLKRRSSFSPSFFLAGTDTPPIRITRGPTCIFHALQKERRKTLRGVAPPTPFFPFPVSQPRLTYAHSQRGDSHSCGSHFCTLILSRSISATQTVQFHSISFSYLHR